MSKNLQYEGNLEVDLSKGVIYFHSPKHSTILRICGLRPLLDKEFSFLDITCNINGYALNKSYTGEVICHALPKDKRI